MRKTGNILRVGAVVAALAPATQAAQAETVPTQKYVDNYLNQSYAKLKADVNKFARRDAVRPNSIGRVVVTDSETMVNGSSGKNLELTSFVYSKAAHLITASSINLYIPGSSASSSTAPEKLFSLSVYNDYVKGNMVPKTPVGFVKDLADPNKTKNSNSYSYIQLVQPDGGWEVSSKQIDTGKSIDYQTDEQETSTVNPNTSAEANFSDIQALVKQAEQALETTIDNKPTDGNYPKPLDINTEH